MPGSRDTDAMALVAEVRDVVLGRVDDDAPPAWCSARGWTTFLQGLDEAELARCEVEGLGARVASLAGAPAELVELARRIAAATALPELAAPARLETFRRASARKQLPIAALVDAVRPMAAAARRVVDVGAGRGHLTRVASDVFAKEALGLEREAGRVAVAGELASGSAARFAVFDAFAQELELDAVDLALGLHACGAVGNRLVAAAARAGCDVALVSCCLQKIEGRERSPLSKAGAESDLVLPKEALGLSNQTAGERGVETTLFQTLEARRVRFALRLLLRARGDRVEPGEEMRGVNRRRARHGLADVAARALALRGLSPATPSELAAFDEAARLRFGVIRRLSLPRGMIARLVEVAVARNRAAALVESGHRAVVATMAPREATPRNVVVLASRNPSRLPRAGEKR